MPSTAHKRGFTLVEILVSVSIMSMVMTIVLFGYSSFNDGLALGSSVQEMAIAVRQAQTYGLTVKEAVVGGGNFNSAYGIYFNPVSEPGDYYLFVDKNSNAYYDVGTGCGSGSTECVEKISLTNNVKISSICNDSGCVGTNIVNIIFLRPNPDAQIYFGNSLGINTSGPHLNVRVALTSPQGVTRNVIIESTGQILIQ